jgi:hypothetical protein
VNGQPADDKGQLSRLAPMLQSLHGGKRAKPEAPTLGNRSAARERQRGASAKANFLPSCGFARPDATGFDCSACLCRSGLFGLSAGCQDFGRYDRNRTFELRPLAVYASASIRGDIWIYGFWTGLNYVAAASDQTQAKTDEAAIAAQVEKTCAQQTSQPLASAVWTTYLESKK